MIPFYLNILPEEHVYSWLARCFWLSGQFKAETYLKTQRVTPIELKPNEPLLKTTSKVCNFASHFNSGIDLYINATTLPLWALSMNRDRFYKFLSDRKFKRKSNLIHLSDFGMFSGTSDWKVCTKCITEDVSNYGSSFWHTKHQLNGINTCYKHGTRLVTSVTRISALSKLLLPHQIDQWKTIEEMPCNGAEAFYEFYYRIFDAVRSDVFSAFELKSQLYTMLGIEKLKTQQRRIACEQLERKLIEELGLPFLKNFFTHYAKGKNSRSCGVMPSLAIAGDLEIKIRNPLYTVVALFWKRHELKLAKSITAHACPSDLQAI